MVAGSARCPLPMSMLPLLEQPASSSAPSAAVSTPRSVAAYSWYALLAGALS
ncbi:MAG: hypothetical protein KDI23_10040 [Pseudomonadales bacterium]|nr:hypothetical protein [Pseudomonadales bacterium]